MFTMNDIKNKIKESTIRTGIMRQQPTKEDLYFALTMCQANAEVARSFFNSEKAFEAAVEAKFNELDFNQ